MTVIRPGAVLVLLLLGAGGCSQPTVPVPGPTESTVSRDQAQPLRARAAHTATLLADGRVLLAGGCAVDGCSTAEVAPTSEFYTPGRGFSAGPAMARPRDAHTATTLPDGRVLIVGGFAREGTPPLAETELFDPTTDRFGPTGSLHTARGGHVAVLMGNGKVLVAGGWIGPRTYTDSVEIFDPASGTFASGPAMPAARLGAAAIALPDGRVLVTGGQEAPDRGQPTAWVYLPAAVRWQAVGPMGTPRFKHAMALLPDGRVLVLGGTTDDRHVLATTEVFDPATNTFTPGPDMGVERYKITDAVTVAKGRVVVAGGTQIDTYDASSARFQLVPGSQGVWRSFPTATALIDGSVLIVGGYDERIRIHHDALLVPAK